MTEMASLKNFMYTGMPIVFTTVILERSITLPRHLTAMEKPPKGFHAVKTLLAPDQKLSEKN